MATARDFGLVVGRLEPGPHNAITDVPGVAVGHRDVSGEGIFTGVTAVLPHGGDLFRQKVRAAVERALATDKKRAGGTVSYVALARVGEPVVLTLPPREIMSLLKQRAQMPAAAPQAQPEPPLAGPAGPD